MNKQFSAVVGKSYRANRPLTDDELLRAAPSIFGIEAAPDRSDRFAVVPTIDIINGLRREGFHPFSVVQSRSRIDGKQDYAKHMVRLRHEAEIGNADGANEVIFCNAGDGTSGVILSSGFFRQVCANGMVWGSHDYNLSIRHTGDAVNKVIEGSYRVLTGFEEMDDERRLMKVRQMPQSRVWDFAAQAAALRWEDGECPIDVDMLVVPRRTADRKNDVWTIFQRVQENLIRGGLSQRIDGKKKTLRPVTSITESIKINKGLWNLAREAAQIH